MSQSTADHPNDVADAPRISLCMIVRDSARTLPACLESIRPWVDEMVIVDTGSLDETPQIVEQFGGKLFHFPWCDDFAAARNESLRHARGDWLFWMDSDDTISPENGRKLRALVDGEHQENTLGYVLQVHCPGPGREVASDVTAVDHVKLFRNHHGIQFECRIHEQVLMPIRRLGGNVAWTDIFVEHSGADHTIEGRKHKHERDLHLLKLELQDRPNHPFALFNLGMTYGDMGEHEKAVEALERSLQHSQTHESHVPKACALLIHSLSQLGREKDALMQCEESLRHFPNHVELQFRRGVLAHRLGQYDAAVVSFRAALSAVGPREFTSVDNGIAGYKSRHNLALVYRDMQRNDLAEIQWREAIHEAPSFRSAWHGLGHVLVDQGKLETAWVECEKIVDDSPLKAEREILCAEILRRRGQIDEARSLLKQAAEEFEEDVPVWESYARLLFENGAWEDARRALETLTTLDPDNGAALHNLGLVLLNLQERAAAVTALCHSLTLRPENESTRAALKAAQQIDTSSSKDVNAKS